MVDVTANSFEPEGSSLITLCVDVDLCACCSTAASGASSSGDDDGDDAEDYGDDSEIVIMRMAVVSML